MMTFCGPAKTQGGKSKSPPIMGRRVSDPQAASGFEAPPKSARYALILPLLHATKSEVRKGRLQTLIGIMVSPKAAARTRPRTSKEALGVKRLRRNRHVECADNFSRAVAWTECV